MRGQKRRPPKYEYLNAVKNVCVRENDRLLAGSFNVNRDVILTKRMVKCGSPYMRIVYAFIVVSQLASLYCNIFSLKLNFAIHSECECASMCASIAEMLFVLNGYVFQIYLFVYLPDDSPSHRL